MFVLLLKTEEEGGFTSLQFCEAFDTEEAALQHIGPEYAPIQPAGFGAYRMLGSRSGSRDPKTVQETKVFSGSSYLLAEY